MRTRTALSFALVLSLSAVGFATPAPASERVLAQEDDTGEGDPTGEEEEAGGQEEQGGEVDPEEAGAGEGEQEGAAAEEEEGPLWTYQMSRIGLALLLLMLLGIGGAYWNFVAKRQKQGI